MIMKPVLRGLGLFLVSCMLLLASCLKEDQIAKPSYGKLVSARAMNCNTDCLEDGQESDPVIYTGYYQNGPSVTVQITNTNTSIIYTISSSTTIKYVKIDAFVDCAPPGNSNFLPNPYTFTVPIGNYQKCQVVNNIIWVNRENCVGDGPGQRVKFNTSYTIIGKCAPQNCEDETAYGGNTEGAGNSWWYYFDTQGDACQDIYAGQHFMDGGSVCYNSATDMLTITLGPGWSLQAVSESVKIQGYSTVPGNRPSAGHFTTYKGTSLGPIKGNNKRYYVVHLDVQFCE